MSLKSDAKRWIRETFRGMSREEALMWASARSLVELGELTAMWLEGKVMSQPGYNLGAPSTPDPETTELVDVLAGMCRLGYVTKGSEPGIERYGQSADVMGFATPEIVADMYRLFRDVPEVEVHACPVDELGWRGIRTEIYGITTSNVKLMWPGPLSGDGWDAICDSWVLIMEENEVNERGLLWMMLATYILLKRKGLDVKPFTPR